MNKDNKNKQKKKSDSLLFHPVIILPLIMIAAGVYLTMTNASSSTKFLNTKYRGTLIHPHSINGPTTLILGIGLFVAMSIPVKRDK